MVKGVPAGKNFILVRSHGLRLVLHYLVTMYNDGLIFPGTQSFPIRVEEKLKWCGFQSKPRRVSGNVFQFDRALKSCQNKGLYIYVG